jgi:hypothetical protein
MITSSVDKLGWRRILSIFSGRMILSDAEKEDERSNRKYWNYFFQLRFFSCTVFVWEYLEEGKKEFFLLNKIIFSPWRTGNRGIICEITCNRVISFSLKSLFSSVIGGALLSNQLKSMTRKYQTKMLTFN